MAVFETQYIMSSPWAEMWQNPEADALVLLSMLLSKYGEEALDWDPFTIRLEIQDDYHVAPCDEVMNKICALQLIMASKDFFERIDTFINVCNTLAEGDPFFEVFTPLETEEVAYALATVAMARDLRPFNPTIKQYVKTLLKADGFNETNFPEIFSAIFDKSPSAETTRKSVAKTIIESAADSNNNNITNMITDHIGDMFAQFNSLPGLSHMDSHILEEGVILSLGHPKSV